MPQTVPGHWAVAIIRRRALVDSAAKVWTENARKPDQIATVIKHIDGPRRFAASKGAKARSPLALAASFWRVGGHRPDANPAALSTAQPVRPEAVRLADAGTGGPQPRSITSRRNMCASAGVLGGKALLPMHGNTGQPKCVRHSGGSDAALDAPGAARFWLAALCRSGIETGLFIAALGLAAWRARAGREAARPAAGLRAAAPQSSDDMRPPCD